MKKILLIGLTLIIALSACQPKKKIMTPDQVEAEKAAIIKVIEDYNTASEQKDFGAIVSSLADEVIFFGTDSSEIIKTFAEFKDAIQKQWQEYDKISYGPLNDVSIQMDKDATYASIIFGMHADTERAGVTNSYYLRVARTLEKKDGKWFIASGIMGIVRSNSDAQQAYAKPLEQIDTNSVE